MIKFVRRFNDNSKIINKLINYLKNDLEPLKIIGAIAFGSVARGEVDFGDTDIDIVAYSDVFTRQTADVNLNYIKYVGGEFLDKEPIFLEDFISLRIEFFYKIDNIVFDINIFPKDFISYNVGKLDSVHNSFETIIGAMYENAILIFGVNPYEHVIKSQMIPYYNNDLRKYRLNLLNKRIHNLIIRIRQNLDENEDVLSMVFKTRDYFIKYFFILVRKYPFSTDRYIKKQLMKTNYITEEEVNSLLLNTGISLRDSICKFCNVVKKYLDKEYD